MGTRNTEREYPSARERAVLREELPSCEDEGRDIRFARLVPHRGPDVAIGAPDPAGQTVLDACMAPVICLDASGIVRAWNRAAEALLGYPSREVIGAPLPTVPPEEDEGFAALIARAMRGDPVVGIPTASMHEDGGRLPILLNAVPWHAEGVVAGVVLTLDDRSAEVARERDLIAQVAREVRRARDADYVTAVAERCGMATDAPAVFEALAACTAAWADSAGVVDDRADGAGLIAYAARTPETDGPIAALFHALGAGMRPLVDRDMPAAPCAVSLREVPLTGAAMARGYHTLAAVPLHVDDARVATLYAAAHGTTAPLDDPALATLGRAAALAGIALSRLRDDARLRERVGALEAAARHKDAFLATVSHELRTPLTAILGFAHIIVENDALGAERRRGMAEDIVASGGLLLTQVNDLLDIVQLGAGRLTVVPEIVDVTTVVQWCERAVHALMQSKGLAFTCALPPALPPVHANTARLEQVLLNLLVNGYKFTPFGGAVTLTATATEDRVTIAVRDTGIGIAPEHAARIFEPFERVETEYTRTQAGAGVGLAVARHLVAMMGGTIALESTPDVGSTFTVTLRTAVETE